MMAAMTETERDFQEAVIELARLSSWRVAHFRPALTKKGWRTPVAGDGQGFPDLVLTRGPRLVVAELKTARGRLSLEQEAWLDAFTQIAAMNPLVEVHVWRPADWDRIAETLTGRPASPGYARGGGASRPANSTLAGKGRRA